MHEVAVAPLGSYIEASICLSLNLDEIVLSERPRSSRRTAIVVVVYLIMLSFDFKILKFVNLAGLK